MKTITTPLGEYSDLDKAVLLKVTLDVENNEVQIKVGVGKMDGETFVQKQFVDFLLADYDEQETKKFATQFFTAQLAGDEAKVWEMLGSTEQLITS